MDSLSFSFFGVASFVLTTANPWVMVAAITVSVTAVTAIGIMGSAVGLVVKEEISSRLNPDRQQKNK